MGLDQLKDLTRQTQEKIIRHQPFHSLQDFLVRVDPRPAEAENLIRVGALSGLGLIPDLLRQAALGGWQGGQLSSSLPRLRTARTGPCGEGGCAAGAAGCPAGCPPPGADPGAGGGFWCYPLAGGAASIGERVRLAGVRFTWRRSYISPGEALYFVSLEDLEGMLEVVISQAVYSRYKTALNVSKPILVEGLVELDPDSGEPFLRAQRVEVL